MKFIAKWIALTLSMLLLLPVPTSSADELASPPANEELVEAVKLQRAQIVDYEKLVKVQEQDIALYKKELADCHERAKQNADKCSEQVASCESVNTWGYVAGIVGIVFGATVFAIKR